MKKTFTISLQILSFSGIIKSQPVLTSVAVRNFSKFETEDIIGLERYDEA
jgi:hypothetical protein